MRELYICRKEMVLLLDSTNASSFFFPLQNKKREKGGQSALSRFVRRAFVSACNLHSGYSRRTTFFFFREM